MCAYVGVVGSFSTAATTDAVAMAHPRHRATSSSLPLRDLKGFLMARGKGRGREHAWTNPRARPVPVPMAMLHRVHHPISPIHPMIEIIPSHDHGQDRTIPMTPSISPP
jgi:hypothetical protein